MSMRENTSNKLSKQEFQKTAHKTSPPRLEGKVKNAGMNPVRKPKKTVEQKSPTVAKPQSTSVAQRKAYQLKGPRHTGK